MVHQVTILLSNPDYHPPDAVLRSVYEYDGWYVTVTSVDGICSMWGPYVSRAAADVELERFVDEMVALSNSKTTVLRDV